MVKFLKCISFWLVIIGALNWGLVGFFQFDLVAFLLGTMSIWSRLIYALVGISALVYALIVYTCCKEKEDY